MTRRIQAKKTTTRKQYSKEFKDEALALAERLGVPTAAKELGLHESQLYGWRVKSRAERDQSETERNQAAEIARLKRKVADQAEELAIVKKAAAYFAKSLK
jgi:transposase